jgi:hypothetical protein
MQLAFLTEAFDLCLAGLDGSHRTLGRAGSVREVHFSIDDARIQSRDEHGTVSLWEARPPDGRSAESPAGAPFRDRAHPYQAHWRAGMFQLVDERTQRVVARIPSNERLVGDPTGTLWAGRRSHFALCAD